MASTNKQNRTARIGLLVVLLLLTITFVVPAWPAQPPTLDAETKDTRTFSVTLIPTQELTVYAEGGGAYCESHKYSLASPGVPLGPAYFTSGQRVDGVELEPVGRLGGAVGFEKHVVVCYTALPIYTAAPIIWTPSEAAIVRGALIVLALIFGVHAVRGSLGRKKDAKGR